MPLAPSLSLQCVVLRGIEIALRTDAQRERPPSNLLEALMSKLRPVGRRPDVAALVMVEAEAVPAWVASSESQRTIPVADREGDSDHASNFGRSIHRRRPDTQNDAVPASNTLRCHFTAGLAESQRLPM
jgi:hypothetical protein